jgi:plastocyanin domain-containing protein
MSRLTLTLFAAAVAALPFAGSAQTHDHGAMMKEAAGAATSAKTPRTVEMTLSEDGVSPSEVKATKGEPLRLAITRKTNSTCITGVVVQDYGINQPLPLNKTVLVDITPKASGKVRFMCPMGMAFATMIIQ